MSDAPTGEPVRDQVPIGQSSELAQGDPYYIVAPAPLAGERDRVLKQGDTFAVLDHHGDIRPVGMKEQGLFHEGTRFLSCLVLRLGRGDPLFLSSTVKEDNALLAVDLTNPDIREGDHVAVPRGTVHLFRGVFLWEGVCYQRIRVRNYGAARVQVSFSLRFESDFADIFEVRGSRRPRRGRALPPLASGGTVALGYEGLDGIVRRTGLTFSPAPQRLTAAEAHFTVALDPQQEMAFHLTVACESAEAGAITPQPRSYDGGLERATAALAAARALRQTSTPPTRCSTTGSTGVGPTWT
jgi:glycogen debranching enzyme